MRSYCVDCGVVCLNISLCKDCQRRRDVCAGLVAEFRTKLAAFHNNGQTELRQEIDGLQETLRSLLVNGCRAAVVLEDVLCEREVSGVDPRQSVVNDFFNCFSVVDGSFSDGGIKMKSIGDNLRGG